MASRAEAVQGPRRRQSARRRCGDPSAPDVRGRSWLAVGAGLCWMPIGAGGARCVRCTRVIGRRRGEVTTWWSSPAGSLYVRRQQYRSDPSGRDKSGGDLASRRAEIAEGVGFGIFRARLRDSLRFPPPNVQGFCNACRVLVLRRSVDHRGRGAGWQCVHQVVPRPAIRPPRMVRPQVRHGRPARPYATNRSRMPPTSPSTPR